MYHRCFFRYKLFVNINKGISDSLLCIFKMCFDVCLSQQRISELRVSMLKRRLGFIGSHLQDVFYY